jgi:hypothetical protein
MRRLNSKRLYELNFKRLHEKTQLKELCIKRLQEKTEFQTSTWEDSVLSVCMRNFVLSVYSARLSFKLLHVYVYIRKLIFMPWLQLDIIYNVLCHLTARTTYQNISSRWQESPGGC